MKLVIAEKPSVAQSLARVIGADKRRDGYLEGGGYLVSWSVGHLVELSAPERYDERFAKWRIEDLPILPERWLYEVSQATGKQYREKWLLLIRCIPLNKATELVEQYNRDLAAWEQQVHGEQQPQQAPPEKESIRKKLRDMEAEAKRRNNARRQQPRRRSYDYDRER